MNFSVTGGALMIMLLFMLLRVFIAGQMIGRNLEC